MYSGTISGPVWLPKKIFGPAGYDGRNHSFFFFSYEPLRIADETFLLATRIPTARELTGDLRESYEVLTQCSACVTALRSQGADAALAALRAQYAAGTAPQLYYQFDRNAQGMPFGIRYTNRNQYVPIPNNDLTAALANNPIARRLLAFYPTPQNPNPYVRFIRPDGLWDQNGNNVFFARGVRNEDTRYNMRFDHALTRNDRLAFRYTFVPVIGVRYTFDGPNSPANNIPQDRNLAQNFFFSHTRNFGASKVNEFRATYTRADQNREPSAVVTSKDWGAELGLRPATLGKGFPLIASLAPGFAGGTLGIGGRDGRTLDVNLGISDDFSWITGRHALKFGVDFRAFQMNRYDLSFLQGGFYAFGAAETNNGVGGGSALASFILGIVSSYQVKTVQVPFYYRWKYYAGYAQDDFKVRPNLTINYGLRYSVETPRTEKYNRQGSFDPNVTGTLNGFPVKGGFVFSGEQGRMRTLWKTNYMGFEPRLGIAWTPLERMTVRTSFALLRAPLTGLSNFILPDLNVPTTAIGGNNGGVNPGYINVVTNPVGPIPPNIPLSNGPLFNFAGFYVDPSSAVPYAQQWFLALQYQVSRDLVFEVAYNGNKGTHLFSGSTDFNQPSYDAIRNAIKNRVNLNATTPNAFGITDASGRLLTVTALQALRPYQHFFNNPIQSLFDRRGNSIYHALYVQARQRLSKGLLLHGSFSWSKSIDDASSSFGGAIGSPTDIYGLARPQDPTNLRAERAVSTYDIPWKLAYGFNYDLPFGRGKLLTTNSKALNAVIGDWSLSGQGAYFGGYPIWLRLGNQGYWFSVGGGDNVLPGATIRPNIVPGQPLINPDWRKDPYTISYINPAAISIPGSLDNPEFGSASRTLSRLRNPNGFVFDASLRKGIKLRSDGKVSLQLRGDFINALNHPSFFFNPNVGHDLLTSNFNRNSLTDPNQAPFTINPAFGKFLNVTPARSIRVAAKLIW